ncbi:MAG: hypothetical protein E7256_13510 [Lachnospiraceae bacterium]|nr:hypothetical protein [Lachnospiraceae bacterium]
MNRHAYLIIAHEEPELLKKLICFLDHPESDIFIHIDKKSKLLYSGDYTNSVKNASLNFVTSKPITWGGFSLVDCELDLLALSTKTKHQYYHLLSGCDLPLMSYEEMLDFWEKNQGTEFIEFDTVQQKKPSIADKIGYYYFFQDVIGRKLDIFSVFLRKVEAFSIRLQKLAKINRMKKDKIILQKGSNWFSITDDLAHYIISKRNDISRMFAHTLCADEIFLQTVVYNSPFMKTTHKNNLRYIDWKRGTPYTFTMDDYDSLMSSSCLWARKFSSKKDEKIIDAIYNSLIHH